jgi:predicted ABC-type ATPase
MTDINISRLRMFAGPNGSGKSTIKALIKPKLLGFYVNPDEIEKEMNDFAAVNLGNYGIKTTHAEVLDFFSKSTLLEKADLLDEVYELSYNQDRISFFNVGTNSYWASVTADFIRQKLMTVRASFTLETVMSSPDKVDLLRHAQRLGYRNYLYYVATEDPLINVSRVSHRVRTGGHTVPEDKIISRYYRSLDLLIKAIKCTNRTYIFDNSGINHTFVAEITDGKMMETKVEPVPNWFKKYVLDRL